MNNKIIYGDNEEEYRHDSIEDALEIVWDYGDDPEQNIFTVYQGEITEEYIYEGGCKHKVVTNIKERLFRMIKNDDYFYFENFEEIIEGDKA